MELLSDELLLETYDAAIQFALEPEFIDMLELEMKRRQLSLEIRSMIS
jgi:developmental checkpoint coupling sporulation initiation to replication initiation